MSDASDLHTISPKEILRATRPERFSDTNRSNEIRLNRSNLEYHLHSLTTRNQETDFERFAFSLCKLEVCPNLRPQTGPTGGGDSKADSETFPVTDSLTFLWQVGENAGSERWAFAFSAKADWRPKLKSDIMKLADAKRGYERAFFVTNQAIPDKKRAEVEDTLTEQFGFAVTVFDRTWILDRVFSNSREQIAIDELKIEGQSVPFIQQGPLDTERQKEFDQVTAQITTDIEAENFTQRLAENCSRTAILARELERPREEIEGLFRRAERVCKKVGSENHLKKISYDQAWTAFFYFEDFEEFDLNYEVFEKKVDGSENPLDIERLNNLWTLFHSAAKLKDCSDLKSQSSKRLITVAKNFQRLQNSEGRPTASLYASALLAIQKIVYEGLDTKSETFSELREILSESSNLVGFPLSSIIENIFQLEECFGEDSEFEKLMDYATEISAISAGDADFAYTTAHRGSLKLENGKYFDAVELLGKTIVPFSNNDTREELVSVLNLLGYAYERIGLYWAARAAYLHAASHAMRQFETYNESKMAFRMASTIGRLKWVELVLGRPVEAIGFYGAENVLWSLAESSRERSQKIAEEQVNFDFILCILIMRAEKAQLQILTQLPNALRNFELECTRLGLLHALGHPPDESPIPIATQEEAEEQFSQLQDQPAGTDLPSRPILNDTTATHVSNVMGSCIRITSSLKTPNYLFAESILASIESLFATAGKQGIFAIEPEIEIEIVESESLEISHEFTSSSTGFQCCVQLPTSKFSDHSRSSQQDFMEESFKLAGSIGIRVFRSSDDGTVMVDLLSAESTVERVSNSTMSFVILENLLGNESPKKAADLHSRAEEKFQVKRDEKWTARCYKNIDSEASDTPEFPGHGNISHKDLSSDVLIRPSIWDDAKWDGALFAACADQPPVIGLLFGNREKGEEIFSTLRNTIGAEDSDNRLRLVIVKGIQSKNPNAYRIVLVPNLQARKGNMETKYVQVHVLGKTLEPSTGENLALFVNEHRKYKYCFITSASFSTTSNEPEFSFEHCIGKGEISIRDAWEIGLEDEDSVAISPNDDPIIPAGITAPPVIALLQELQEKGR